MPKIYSEKDPLPIERIRITKPANKNGTHFIKTLDIDDPIYFLAPKCFVKQGFVNHGKKVFCDFVFSNDNSDFFSWLENLEETAKSGIYENREKWFETPLDEHDIESSMTSPYKPYKSGKFFVIRANVPTALGKINIKVYDEHENETEPESIKENTKVLAVLEFQGIRCGVRSFQFEIELKQILIVEPEKIFEKCVIATTKTGSAQSNKLPSSELALTNSNNAEYETPIKFDEAAALHKEDEVVVSFNSTDLSALNAPDTSVEHEIPSKETQEDICANGVELEAVEILNDDFPLDLIENSPDDPPIRLKSRNDVYYKLYKETRRRAKEAKQEALANYLEAKRIKTTYLLESASDSESDLDELESAI